MRTKNMISIVDDDDSFREAIKSLVEAMGFMVTTFPSAVDFLASCNFSETACLIADVHMPRMSGIELHNRLATSGYAIPTILITAYLDESAKARALADGVICYLGKPLDDKALLRCISSALKC